MSRLSDEIRSKTSKGSAEHALLVLEDGTSFHGYSCAACGEVFGEICFNTSLEGYLEIITDPSYAGQIVTLTYPQIGNYGVSEEDIQRGEVFLRGLVVRDMCETPSNWRSEMSLSGFLRMHGVVAIEGIDTRALVKHIREVGAMRAALSTECLDEDQLLARVRESSSIVGENLVCEVSKAKSDVCSNAGKHSFAIKGDGLKCGNYKVAAYDCGVKASIIDNLERIGAQVDILDWNAPAQDVLSGGYDGVFLSNGPGDPDAVSGTYDQVSNLIGKIPIFGICLGHQMLSKAAGADIEKLKFGHRGGNQPVMNLITGRVEITAQNHGFGQVFSSLGRIIPEESGGYGEHEDDLRVWVRRGVAPVVDNDRFGRIRLTHVNLNDGTPEGMEFLDVPAFSVQYHPEANPGPTDSHYLFTAFAHLMDGEEDYLGIDIAKDRLGGWKF